MPAKKALTPEAARLRMADLCARSEQCEHDIRQKLFKYGLTLSQSNDIIDYLVSNKFIDDTRFAKSFARDKCRFSAWGRNKIRMALAAKRIPASCIHEALDSIEEEEWAEATQRAAKAKARSLDLSDRTDRMKLYRYLLTHGFESSLASRAIKDLL